MSSSLIQFNELLNLNCHTPIRKKVEKTVEYFFFWIHYNLHSIIDVTPYGYIQLATSFLLTGR